MRRLAVLPLLAALAACSILTGCSKPSEGTASASATLGPLVPEFGSTDPSAWVNGAPMSFASARGSVVLVEAWDRF